MPHISIRLQEILVSFTVLLNSGSLIDLWCCYFIQREMAVSMYLLLFHRREDKIRPGYLESIQTEDKMYNAFWRHGLFVRGQSFSVKIFDSSRNCCQVIGEGAGNDFRGPSVQALPLPPRFSFSSARFFLCLLLPSACYAGYRVDEAVS